MNDVRRAVTADVDRIVDMAHVFNDAHVDMPLASDKTWEQVFVLVESHSVFVSDGGFILGAVSPAMFHDWTYLAELGWYATDNSGSRLLQAFMDEAVDLGVDELRMCTMSTSSPIADKLLAKKGFVPIETSHRLLIQ